MCLIFLLFSMAALQLNGIVKNLNRKQQLDALRDKEYFYF